MKPEFVFYLIIGVLLIGGIGFNLISYGIKQKRNQIFFQKLKEHLPNAEITEERKKPYAFKAETDSHILLIKPVFMNPSNELIITNPDFWCVNSDPRNWNRSTNPELITGVSEFRKSTFETEKTLIRLGVIYPGCLNVTRYLNECDVEVVTDRSDIGGVRIVCFDSLPDFFAKLQKK